jgi:signal transduction histidine kinase
MRERVRQIGGALQIQSNSNGTSVLVVLPVRATGTESSMVGRFSGDPHWADLSDP